MFHIVAHCRPKEDNKEFHGKVIGAFVSILIDYKDYDGAMVLSKYYIEEQGWEIISFEDEYYTFESQEELPEDYRQYFDELSQYGYSMVFNTYNSEEVDESG